MCTGWCKSHGEHGRSKSLAASCQLTGHSRTLRLRRCSHAQIQSTRTSPVIIFISESLYAVLQTAPAGNPASNAAARAAGDAFAAVDVTPPEAGSKAA